MSLKSSHLKHVFAFASLKLGFTPNPASQRNKHSVSYSFSTRPPVFLAAAACIQNELKLRPAQPFGRHSPCHAVAANHLSAISHEHSEPHNLTSRNGSCYVTSLRTPLPHRTTLLGFVAALDTGPVYLLRITGAVMDRRSAASRHQLN